MYLYHSITLAIGLRNGKEKAKSISEEVLQKFRHEVTGAWSRGWQRTGSMQFPDALAREGSWASSASTQCHHRSHLVLYQKKNGYIWKQNFSLI
jgi:hypothetical protein